MTAEVVAAKLATYIATDEKARNVVIGIVAGFIILISSLGLIFFTVLFGATSVIAADSLYYYPVPGHTTISSGYDPQRVNPVTKKVEPHLAVDFPAPEGTPIVAARGGTVWMTGIGSEPGKYIWLEHSDGSKTMYCHCSEILVKVGDEVAAGDPIALVGNTGVSTGSHCHFQLRTPAGDLIDPTPLLQNWE
jgi:murein DD-endopeptidase MepM/ murein hydrolase activator NlpD